MTNENIEERIEELPRNLIRMLGAFQGIVLGSIPNYFSYSEYFPSALEDIQRGDIKDFVSAATKLTWVAGTTFFPAMDFMISIEEDNIMNCS